MALNKKSVVAVLVLLFMTTGHTTVAVQEPRFELQGEVKDEAGALVIGAKVSLKEEKAAPRETLTNEQGRFRFDGLGAGSYQLEVTGEGFAAFAQPLTLRDGTKPQRLEITLFPGIKETVNVGNNANGISMDAEHATGTKVITGAELEDLPDDPDELNDRLQQLATSAGGAPGDAIVTVDGFDSGGMLPPKSAIREVRVNPNLFSAEFDKPPYQGGRIEVYTKPGASAFHGSASFGYNGAALNARDPFAPRRAPLRTRRYGVQFGNSIVPKRAGYLVSFEGRNIEDTATINAVTLGDDFQPLGFASSLRTPKQLLLGSARADWQLTPAHTLVARYEFNSNRLDNQGVGGFDLPERAYQYKLSEHGFRFSDTAILNRTMLNEARIGFTKRRITQRGTSNAPNILVLGAFTAGGSSAQDVTRDESLLELDDNFSLVAGAHSLKFGIQLTGRNITDARAENFNGTFLFGGGSVPQLDAQGNPVIGNNGAVFENISGFEQYRRTLLGLPGGTPTRFSLATGEPETSIHQWLFSAFIQDEWRLRRNLSLSFGLRYEAQTAPSDKFSLAPRIGIAYTPDKQQRWVVRARAGLFFDRFTDFLPLEVQRFDGVRRQQIIIDRPSYPDPFAAGTSSAVIPTIRQFEDGLRPPTSLLMRVEVERLFPRNWKLQVSHTWTSAWAILRSRNINAPVLDSGTDPRLAPRPLGIPVNVLQFESSGRIKGRVLFVGLNQPTHKYFSLFFGYLNFHFNSDTDTPISLPQSSYDLSGEWSRPSWQSRHQAFMVSSINLPYKLRASVTLDSASGTPFNITTGRDNNGDGNFTDRPSFVDASSPQAINTRFGTFDPTVINGTVPRNFGTNPAIIRFDFGLSRTFVVGKSAASPDSQYKLTLHARANNIFNRTNLLGLNGVVTSPFFGRANTATPARRIEVGLRFSF